MTILDAVHVSNLEILGRLGVGVGLGALIGAQRELDGQDAGIRTHALLSLGSALFGVISVGAFTAFVGSPTESNVQIDVTRIASYLVAGVGFLAGGAIVRHGDRVRGLTTAAELWVTAAIGLAAGVGFYVGALVATAATLLTLLAEKPLNRVMKKKRTVMIRAVMPSSVTLHDVVEVVERSARKTHGVHRTSLPDGRAEFLASGVTAAAKDRILAELEARGDVDELSYEAE